MSSIIKRVGDEKWFVMPTSWSECLCYLHYRVVSWLCDRITRIVYEEDEPQKIPYEWVPEDMEDEVFKFVVKPHLNPLHDRIFHLMMFMRYYDGKFTYKTWNHLYTQYLHRYWVTYHCFKQKREDPTTFMTNPVSSVVWVMWHRMPKLKRTIYTSNTLPTNLGRKLLFRTQADSLHQVT